MDTNMPQQVAAILRFKRFVELLSDPKEGRTYINGEPMAPDATAFLSYFRDIEQGYAEGLDAVARAAAAEAEAARLREAGRMVQEEVAAWRDSYEALNRQRLALAARVAELEAQLAAQQWRPVTEEWPPREKLVLISYPGATWVDIARRSHDGEETVWLLNGNRGVLDFDSATMAHPLPPAPQETTP